MCFNQIIKMRILYLSICLIPLLYFNSCKHESPVNSLGIDDSIVDVPLAKKIKVSGNQGGIINPSGHYPQTGSCTMYFEAYHQVYVGGNFTVKNGSSFTVPYASLTPPSGTPCGANVSVYMTVERDSAGNSLLYNFGPHGCQFNPAAEIWLRWKDLGGGGIPNLYYIDDNGNLIPQTPDAIDMKGKRLLIRVFHFSRYAVAFSQ